MDAIRGGIQRLPSTNNWLLTFNRLLSDFHAGAPRIILSVYKKLKIGQGCVAYSLRPCSAIRVCLWLSIALGRSDDRTPRPTFPNTCLAPDQPGFGQIISGDTRRRRSRRVAGQANGSNHSWSIMSPVDQSLPLQGHLPPLQQQFYVGNPQETTNLLSTRELPLPRSPNPPPPTSHPDSPRYNPYQSSYLNHRPEIHVTHPSDQSYPRRPVSTPPIVHEAHRVTLPPVQPSSSNYAVSLPSVADLVGFNAIGDRDPPKTILERLKRRDSSVHHSPTSLVTLP